MKMIKILYHNYNYVRWICYMCCTPRYVVITLDTRVRVVIISNTSLIDRLCGMYTCPDHLHVLTSLLPRSIEFEPRNCQYFNR